MSKLAKVTHKRIRNTLLHTCSQYNMQQTKIAWALYLQERGLNSVIYTLLNSLRWEGEMNILEEYHHTLNVIMIHNKIKPVL